MVIALALSAFALSSILVYFIYICAYYLPFFIRESTILNHVTLIATQLEWACNFWLCYSLLPNFNYVSNMPAKTNSGQRASDYEWKRATSVDAGECPVCLFRVEVGEEIGELRYDHGFHRFCVETWVEYSNLTFPLCRGPLAPVRFESDQLGMDALVLEFCSTNSRDHDRWLP